ncbi:glycosyltransferase family 2 protein [Chryseobacterium taklimakanense]|uniref:Glycosyltransferase family 2 protein n=1 Tax=Chryseobacterium taklimakanense TaxID=536441 RepID=A0A3G8WJ25_9FLAO|nr:glycosyltransferase family 2 protein [Chryseobacterium taklimakanense]AZI21192.1 glycosyltransferase family 2 protein [Chryseobacterium taklimakanense]
MNISVIIPVYNAGKMLEKAVLSVLQFEEVKEVLLVEDNSPDNSLEVCKKLLEKDSRIKLFQHPDKGNHGAGATRNLGLEKATQEFIAFLDADDYWLPNRFDAEKELFRNAEVEGVFNAIGTEFLTEKGREEFQEKFKNTTLTTVKKHAEGKDVFYGLLGLDNDFGVFFSLIGLTVRRSSIEKHNLRFNPELHVHQDTDFIVKLSYHCYLKSGNITEAIAIRGVHDDNRITKIKPYSENMYRNMALLYSSRLEWATEISAFPPDALKLIKLRLLTFNLAGKKIRLNLYAIY